MKLKYYLRGLGVGILVSTIILMIASAIHKPELSDGEIISRARELGMVMHTETSASEGIPKAERDTETEENTQNEKETEKQKDTEKENGTEEQKDTEKEEKPRDTEKDKKDKTGKTDQPKETEKPKEPQSGKTVKEFTVHRGESSNTVAEHLQEAGLVDDAVKFNEFLVNEKYDSRILPGTVQIPEGASYKEVAEFITVKP